MKILNIGASSSLSANSIEFSSSFSMLYSEDIFSLSINSPIPLSLPQATKIKPNKIKKLLVFN